MNVTDEVSLSTTAVQLAEQSGDVALIDNIIFRNETFQDIVVRPFDTPKFVDLKLLFPTNRARSKLSIEFQSALKSVIAGAPVL